MEDVRTSESLEKEVLEDARKKAERVFRNAEKQVEELGREWNGRIEAELSALAEEFARRKSSFERGLLAAVPLEKSRKKLEYLDGRFEETISAFFSSLGEEEAAKLLALRGKRAAGLLGNPPHAVQFSGLSRETAERVAVSLGVGKAAYTSARGYRGLVFLGEDGGVRFRLTLDEAAGELRERARRRIIEALFRGKY